MATEVSALLDEGTARLGRIADDPRREAEVLLGAALGRSRAWLLAHAEERILDCEATDRYEAFVTRRAQGEPAAYILGETELVVERALAHLPADAPADVLDLAAGSGAIALAIASERPACRIVGSDLSAAAIAAARTNASRLGLDRRVEFRAGPWFEPVSGLAFDLLASNPPYIADGDPRVEAAVRRYEPHAALFAGPSGLEALSRIARGAPAHLKPGGWIVLEHGDQQGVAVRGLLGDAGFADVATYPDLAGLERCTEGRWPVTPAPSGA
jgi:release factor glutamine methyltransferase